MARSQTLLRAWSATRRPEAVPNPAVMLEQASLPWFAALNASLRDRLDDRAFRERFRHSTRQMRTLAAEIALRAVPRPADTGALRRVVDDGERLGSLGIDAPAMLFAPS